MELKATLQDYTQPEFLALVEKIWAVDVRKQDHETLISHFDRVSGHPKGADLIFYPGIEFEASGHDAGNVVQFVKSWQNRQGKTAFKGEVLPAPKATPGPRLSVREQALIRSSKELSNAQKMDSDLDVAGVAADQALTVFESSIAQLLIPTSASSAEANNHALSLLMNQVDVLEEGEDVARSKVHKFEFFKMRVDFAKAAAQRNLTNSFYDQTIQAQVLMLAVATHERYGVRLAALKQRHRDIHVIAQEALDRAEEMIIRLRGPFNMISAAAERVFEFSLLDTAQKPSFVSTGPAIRGEYLEGLGPALRSAIAEFSWRITSSTEPLGHYAPILEFEFASVVDAQRYGLSVPLSELIPLEGRSWQSLARAKADVYLPFRLGSGVVATKQGSHFRGLKEIKELSQVYVTPTNGTTLPSFVKVRSALWDIQRNRYVFTADGLMPMSIEWTLPRTLQDAPPLSTELLAVRNRVGFVHTPALPLLEPYVSIEDVEFDDYVVVFPEGSGIDPLYLMFKGACEYPGVATGQGQPATAGWLTSALKEEGALVPSQVADQLRGQVFKRFDLFTQALWKAVAATPFLNTQFSALNQQRLHHGSPPFADEVALKDPFLLLHRKMPAEGGLVYDMDNLEIDY